MKVFIKIAFISLSIILFYTQTTLAQSKVFNNVYNDYSYKNYSSNSNGYFYNNESLHKIAEHNNFYTLYGTGGNHYYFAWEDSFYVYNYMVDIDEFGDSIQTKRINLSTNDDRESTIDGLKINNQEYLVGMTNHLDLSYFENINAKIIKLDNNRDTLWTREYNMGDDNKFVTIKTNDNGATFQVLGFADVDTFGINYDAFISTIDSNGNLISNIQLGGGNGDFLYALEYLDNGNYFLAGYQNLPILAKVWLLEVEPNGNIVWEKTYGTVNNNRLDNSKEMLRKGNHIYIACISSDSVIYNGSKVVTDVGWLLKLDLQGNIIWDKKYARGEWLDKFKGIQSFDDETLILGGQTTLYDGNTYYPIGWILKIDTNGNIIWERTIQKYTPADNNGSEPHHYVADMLVSSDKGILLGGYIIANYITDDFGYFHRNDAWLAKTDSCGYTVGDIPEPFFVVDSIQNNNKNHTVFISDQSQDYCTAEIDWGDGSENTTYYAYENNLPLAEKQFQHNYSQDGSYVIKVTTLAGEEYRGYLAPVNIVGVGITDLAQENGFISLFPNPANEYIVVQNVNSSVMAITKELVCLTQSSREAICKDVNDCFTMSIYNLNGKELKSFNLNPKLYQQKMDVSSLNNGVYFVTFRINGIQVGTEKMVIAK